MIDLAYEKEPDAQQIAEMLVDAIHGAVEEHNEEVAAAAEAATLQSPILRLVKERNEARELVKRLLYTADLGEDSKDKFDAVIDGHKALFKWKGGAQ